MMKNLLFIGVMLISLFSCTPPSGQLKSTKAMYTPDTSLLASLFEKYKEPTLRDRRFKHRHMLPLILKRQGKGIFDITELGKSVQGRSIYQLQYGSGTKKIMLWSQMHGNESTATMALFDLFNFLEAKDDGYDSIRHLLKEQTTLFFLPMINPDGAEIFNRRNALDIDLNRDARATSSPESNILKQAAEKNNAHFGFNLHDQQIYYNVPGTSHPATISFLAPAYNQAKEINQVRGRAMQLIVGMNALLQQYIPHGVAKYDDHHEPRGFGDNFQKWGTSTVLIESGGYPGDPEKQHIRKLNFVILLNALIEIAQDSYLQYDQEKYQDIPENDNKLCDLLIKNINVQQDSFTYQVDLAIKRDEINGSDSLFYVRGRIDDVGDLKDSYGYEELDAQGLTFMKGKLSPTLVNHPNDLNIEKVHALLKQGYLAVKIRNVGVDQYHSLPILLSSTGLIYGNSPTLGSQANFFLARNGNPIYAIINGVLIPLDKPLEKLEHNHTQ